MSRILELELVLLCFYILSVLSVQCNDKTEAQNREIQSTSAGNSLIVSMINNVVKLKDNYFFKSGIESSVRSMFSKPLTSAVYALSVVAGVVAMLAFYESPVSPMPVPSLPDPPVGRFPPEHPIWPPPQRDPMHTSDKKRVGMNWSGSVAGNEGPAYNPNAGSAYYSNSGQLLFPQMNTNQKYSQTDPSTNAGAYQQLLNLIEKRNSNISSKQNRISTSMSNISPQLYSSFSVESDPKALNDSIKLQTLSDRHESIEIINKFYNQNNLNALKSTSNSELLKEKLNYTLIASTEPNPNTKVSQT